MKKYFERDYQSLVVCSRNIYLEVKYIFKRTINCVPNVTKHFVPNVTKHSETPVVINKGKNNRAGFCFFSYEDKCYYTLVKTGARLMNF